MLNHPPHALKRTLYALGLTALIVLGALVVARLS